ncbi:MAG: leucine-rich repeat domain-containing protein [Oscillospiraceae bacterium]|nr:leucine-rich repeat domain-containing protein [Oscillospiraceae bacterium]
MKLRRAVIVTVSLIYLCFLALCCFSGPVNSEGVTETLIGTPSVSFAAGSFPIDSAELTLVVQAGEVSRLDGFTALRSADLSGSTCYAEIAAWAEKHPEVSVKYTVAFPGGVTADNSAESLALSGLDSAGAAEAAGLLQYLPKLKSVDLGSAGTDAALTGSDITALRAACPDAEFKYSFTLLGRPVSLNDTTLDLTGLTSADAAAAADMLGCMPKLAAVTLGTQDNVAFTWEDVGLLEAAAPDAAFDYSFVLWGKSVNLSDATLDLNHITMDDGGAAVRAVLPYMNKCTTLDMDFCGVSNESMASIRADFPNIKVIWRIWFGEQYSVRTDVIKILASKPSVGGVVDNAQAAVLKYCTDLKYLDLGHNEALTDLSFMYGMPNLEVLVIAMNPLVDLSPLASCPKLEYIELNSTDISDLSPLSGLTNLRHLNIGNCKNVSDISPLYGLKDLERLWIGSVDPVPAEQVAEMQAAAPNCKIDTTTLDPTLGGWRYADLNDKGWDTWEKYGYFDFDLDPRYELLREQFGYDKLEYSFSSNDPLYNGSAG